jgi:hypothetical protein
MVPDYGHTHTKDSIASMDVVVTMERKASGSGCRWHVTGFKWKAKRVGEEVVQWARELERIYARARC